MSYDLHITRRKDWSGSGDDISIEEWLAYVRGHAKLALQAENSSGCAEWVGSSSSDAHWLHWSEGQIYCKNPKAASSMKCAPLLAI